VRCRPYTCRGRISESIFSSTQPVETDQFRTLGSQGNIFAIEFFMDELADARGRDPFGRFRLAPLGIPGPGQPSSCRGQKRAGLQEQGRRAVMERSSLCRYKSIGLAQPRCGRGYRRKTGVVKVPRVVMAAYTDSWVNPDGAKNQIEGGIVSGCQPTLTESCCLDRRRSQPGLGRDIPSLLLEKFPAPRHHLDGSERSARWEPAMVLFLPLQRTRQRFCSCYLDGGLRELP